MKIISLFELIGCSFHLPDMGKGLVLFKVVTPAVIFLSLLLIVAPTKLAAQNNHGCGCGDIIDLQALLGAYDSALGTLQQFQGTIGPNVLLNEIAPAPNPTRISIGTSMSNAIQAAITQANNTPCTASIAQMRSSILRRHFDSYITQNNRGHIDFMPVQTWIGYQMDSFRRASDEVLRILQAMPRTCRPGYWFGTIKVIETHQVTTTITVPPRSQTSLGGEQVSGENTIRTGTISLSGVVSNPSSTVGSWTASGSSTFSAVSRTKTRCEGGGLKGALPLDHTVTGGLHRSLSKAGSVTLPTVVSIGEPDDAGQIPVSFEIPTMSILQDGNETVTSSGGCPGSEFNRSTAVSGIKGELTSQSGTVTISRFLGDPEKLSGSKVIDLTPESLPRNVTASHRIQVTVNLYKLRP